MTEDATVQPPVMRRTGNKSTAVLTTADQILSSASNALIVFTLAQTSTADQFGLIALILTVVAVCTGFVRGALGTPLLLISDLDDREIVAEAGYAVTFALLSGLAAGVVILTGGALIGEWHVALAFAIGAPFILVQDVLRMAAVTMGRPGIAVLADGLWTATVLAIFVANLLDAGVPAIIAVYVWGIAGAASAMVLAGCCGVRPLSYHILEWWRTYYPARLRFGSLPASSQLGGLLVTAAAVISVSSSAAAGIRGAMTLFGPITILISALPMVFVPRATRRRHLAGFRAQWRELVGTATITSLLTLAATAVLVFLPDAIGEALLGDTWSQTIGLIVYVGVLWAALCWVVSVYIFLQAQGLSRAAFWLNAIHMSFQFAVCIAAGLVWDDVNAIGIGLAASGCIVAAVAAMGVRVWVGRHEDETAPSADANSHAKNGALAV